MQPDPNHGAAWNDLGMVMEALGNPLEAIACYRRAIAAGPGGSEARQNLKMLAMSLHMASALQRQAFTSMFDGARC